MFFSLIFKPVRYGEMIQFDYAFCFSNRSKSVHILDIFWVAVGRRNTRIGEKIAPLSEDLRPGR